MIWVHLWYAATARLFSKELRSSQRKTNFVQMCNSPDYFVCFAWCAAQDAPKYYKLPTGGVRVVPAFSQVSYDWFEGRSAGIHFSTKWFQLVAGVLLQTSRRNNFLKFGKALFGHFCNVCYVCETVEYQEHLAKGAAEHGAHPQAHGTHHRVRSHRKDRALARHLT
jgi:hypothetical protein